MESEEQAILYDYLYGNLTQRELAKKYRKSLRDISNIIKSFKVGIQQSTPSPRHCGSSSNASSLSSYPVSQQTFQANRMKVAEVIIEFLKNLESTLAEEVEGLLNRGLMYYRGANIYSALNSIVQARNIIGQTLKMITSEEFTDLIRKVTNFERTIGWYVGDCRKACKEKAWP